MTDRLFDEIPVEFQTLKGVPVDLVNAPDPGKPVDYLRLATGVTRSREFRKFRKAVGPLALAWWVGLLVVTKRDGSFGILDVDDVELAVEATSSADHADDVPEVLRAAERAGLVWLYHAEGGDVQTRVRKWVEWQVPSSKDRQRLLRARAASNVTPKRVRSRQGVTGNAEIPPVTSQDKTRQDKTKPSSALRAGERAHEAEPWDSLKQTGYSQSVNPPEVIAAAFEEEWGALADLLRPFAAPGQDRRSLVERYRIESRKGKLSPADFVRGAEALAAFVAAGNTSTNPTGFIISAASRLPAIKGDPNARTPELESDPDFARFDG